MTLPIVTPIACALLVAAAGAFTDIRTGTIPNWIALPPLVLAPLVYALTTGPEVAMKSLSSAFVSGIELPVNVPVRLSVDLDRRVVLFALLNAQLVPIEAARPDETSDAWWWPTTPSRRTGSSPRSAA